MIMKTTNTKQQFTMLSPKEASNVLGGFVFTAEGFIPFYCPECGKQALKLIAVDTYYCQACGCKGAIDKLKK